MFSWCADYEKNSNLLIFVFSCSGFEMLSISNMSPSYTKLSIVLRNKT
jgi:hypothetical protein